MPTSPSDTAPRGTALDELRRKMLFKQKSAFEATSAASSPAYPRPQEQDVNDAKAMRVALFQGRSVPLSMMTTPTATVESDPHKLFQLLQRKRAVQHQPTCAAVAVLPATPPRSTDSNSVARKAPSRRPMLGRKPFSGIVLGTPTATPSSSPPDLSSVAGRPSSRGLGDSGAPLAPTGANGRPCTRQKHPKHALDLFDSTAGSTEVEHFPRRRASAPAIKSAAFLHSSKEGGSASLLPSQGPPGVASSQGSEDLLPKAEVNFNCLFVTDDDGLGVEDEDFPAAPKAHVEIPLIETDWFTSDSWEPLPTTDDHEVVDTGCEAENYAESLLCLLRSLQKQKQHAKQKP